MNKDVRKKSPHLNALIGAVNERTVDGHWSDGGNAPQYHSVVDEDDQLQRGQRLLNLQAIRTELKID